MTSRNIRTNLNALAAACCFALLMGCGDSDEGNSTVSKRSKTDSSISSPSLLLGESKSDQDRQHEKAPVEPNVKETKAKKAKEKVSDVAKTSEKRTTADLIEAVEPAVVRINVDMAFSKAIGSGFCVSDDGMIVTNRHVIEGAQSATAIFRDGQKRPIKGVLFVDPKKDIAILKIDGLPKNAKSLKLAEKPPRKGESAVAFGAPKGLSFTASVGIVSAVRKGETLKEVGIEKTGLWIQTTTPISKGNSGGPLVNDRGEVIGANTWAFTTGQNLNFAISAIDINESLKLARKGNLTAFSSLPTPGTVGGTEKAGDAVTTLILPAKYAYPHGWKITSVGDKFDDVHGNAIDFENLSGSLSLRVYAFSKKGKSASMLAMMFTSTSRSWTYLRYRPFKLLIDGNKLSGEPSHDGDVFSGGVLETMVVRMSLKTALEIVNAKEVEGKLGLTQFSLDEKKKLALRDLLSRIPTGDTYDGRYKIEQKKVEKDPVARQLLAKKLRNDVAADLKRRADAKRLKDALLKNRFEIAAGKVALAKRYLKQNKRELAKDRLTEVLKNYADTPAAKEAKNLLKGL